MFASYYLRFRGLRGLDQNQLSLAERVVERAAFFEERLTRPGRHNTPEQLVLIRRLVKEYQILRIALVSLDLSNIRIGILTQKI